MRYSSLVGRRVEARYRAGDIYLSAFGTLVSDSGRAICVEELFSHDGRDDGRDNTMRVEIPYDYVIRVSTMDGNEPSQSATPPSK